MSFSPVLPSGGLAGWSFLKTTYDRQKSLFLQSPVVARDVQSAKQTLAQTQSVDDLMSNRGNLKIVLGAFGLENDLDNRYFVRKIIESDLADPKSLASRLSDERYKDLARSMSGLAHYGVLTQRQSQEILDQYSTASFEVAVGRQSNEFRLALNAERELGRLVSSDKSENTKWYKILGTPPLRTVLQTYLRLPDAISKLDLETQVTAFKDKLKTRLGVETLSDLNTTDKMQTLVQGYLLQSQVNTSVPTSGRSIALSLLQSAQGAAF